MPLMLGVRGRAGDLDMKCIMMGQCKISRICLMVLGLVISLTGCDLFDNPPKTLHMAAFKGDVKAAKKFISDGISVNAKGADGERPLHFAVYGNKNDMAKFLLDQGANVNGINSSESTPLHGAAWKGHIAVAELLIAKGADVNVTNKMGKTPLDWAIEQGHTEMATLIRKHGGVQGAKDQH
jgi:ankyrin repeat protein